MSSNGKFDIGAIKKARISERNAVLEKLETREIDGAPCARALSDITDKNLLLLADHYYGAFKKDISLFYGGNNANRMTCPGSDLDLMIVTQDEWDEILPSDFQEAHSKFLYDGLEATGISRDPIRICTVEQFRQGALENHEARTNLLRLRRLWGNSELFAGVEKMAAGFHEEAVTYVQERIKRRQAKVGQPDQNFSILEPNIKDGYGGLRDVDTLLWIGKALGDCHDLSDLGSRGFLSWPEVRELEEAHHFLITLRCHLHVVGQKDRHKPDVLYSHRQPVLAKRFDEFETPENLLRAYYKAARTVAVLTNVTTAAILEKYSSPFQAGPEPLEGFVANHNSIRFKNDSIENPMDLLRICHVAQKEKLGLHHTALRVIRDNVHLVDDAFRADPVANRMFFEILKGKNGESCLREMQEVGLAQAFDQHFAGIDSYRQFDLNHEYTIDEHTRRAIGKLRELLDGKFKENDAFASRIVPDLSASDLDILFAAIHWHDVFKHEDKPGKITHPVKGRDLMLLSGSRWGLNQEQVEKAAWLIEHHLRLWHMAQHLDPQLPATVERLLEGIPSLEHLNLLAVMTTADIMGEKTNNWWHKNEQIQALYDNARARLLKQELKTRKALALPEGYEPGTTNIILDAFNGQANAITIATPDHPGLFKNLVGTLTSERKNILSAEAAIHSNNGSRVIVNRIIFEGNGQILNGNGNALVEKMRKAALSTNIIKFSNPAPHWQPDKVFTVKPSAEIANDLGTEEEGTFVKITAEDRGGLLDDLADVFNRRGLDLSYLKVTTEGNRAVNTFYLKTQSGGKVRDGDAHGLYQDIMECIKL